MKKAEWFARIKFFTFDILIPKDIIITTEHNDKSIPSSSLDSVIGSIFNTPTPHDDITRIFLKSRSHNVISTGCKILLENISLREFSTLPEIALKPYLNKGITAIRFYKDKIQYLIDVQKLLLNWENKK